VSDPNVGSIAAGTPAAPVSTSTSAPVPSGAPVGAVGPTTSPSPPPAPTQPTQPAVAPSRQSGGSKRLQLSTEELNERLRRAKAAALRDVFGTDDAAAIRERLRKAEELEKQAEAARLAQMSEIERMKYERDRARQEAIRYRSELAQAKEREIVREQQSFVERIASRHVNPLYLEEAAIAFARDIAQRDPREVARYTEKDVARWFQRYVERKPALAASPNARRQQRTPAGAATPPPRPQNQASPQTNGGKTFKPGLPNSMTREEARAEARRLGYQW